MFYNVGGVLAAASISKREVCKYMYFQFYSVMLNNLQEFMFFIFNPLYTGNP